MEQLVRQMAEFLVDHPDQLAIERIERGATTVLALRAAAGDTGRLIGRQGRTARALRKVLAAAQRGQSRYILDIVED